MWQVCIEDAGTGILISRVHHDMAFTRSGAIRKANKLNRQPNMARWETVRAVIVPARQARHLTIWRVNLERI